MVDNSNISNQINDFYERALELRDRAKNFACIADRTKLIRAQDVITQSVDNLDDLIYVISERREDTGSKKNALVVECEPLAPNFTKALDSHLENDNPLEAFADLSKSVDAELKDYNFAGQNLENLFLSLDSLIKTRTSFSKKGIQQSKEEKTSLKTKLETMSKSIEKLADIIKMMIERTSDETKDFIEEQIFSKDSLKNIKNNFYTKLAGTSEKLSRLLSLEFNFPSNKKRARRRNNKPRLSSREEDPNRIKDELFRVRSKTDGISIITTKSGAVYSEHLDSNGKTNRILLGGQKHHRKKEQ